MLDPNIFSVASTLQLFRVYSAIFLRQYIIFITTKRGHNRQRHSLKSRLKYIKWGNLANNLQINIDI